MQFSHSQIDFLKILGVCSFLLLASACTTVMVPLPELGVTDQQVEPVFVATTRKPEAPERAIYGFGPDRSENLSFMKYNVSVPKEREPGSIAFPGKRPKAEKHFALVNKNKIDDEARFVEAINRQLPISSPKDRSVFVFIHGYNVPFANGVYTQAQMRRDFEFEAVAVHYSWPSAANLLGYVYDRESAMFARDGLVQTLKLLTKTNARNISIVAHSMGNLVLVEALRDLRREGNKSVFRKIDGVVLAAPDIDLDVFTSQMTAIAPLPQPFVVITNERDEALAASSSLRGGLVRAGTTLPDDIADRFNIIRIDLSADKDLRGGQVHSGFRRSQKFLNIVKDRELTEKILADASASSKKGLRSGVISLGDTATSLIETPVRLITD